MLNSIKIKHIKHRTSGKGRENKAKPIPMPVYWFFFFSLHILNTLCSSHLSVSARVLLGWNQKSDGWKWAVGGTPPHASVELILILTGHCWCQRYIWVEKESTGKIIWRRLWVPHLWLRKFLCHRFLKSWENFLGKYYSKVALESCCWCVSEKWYWAT